MSRIQLVIADSDNLFLEKIALFVRLHYASKFRIITFTQEYSLQEFLKNKNTEVDILLVEQDFISVAKQNPNSKFTAVLTTNKNTYDTLPFPTIFKYQSGDKLIKKLLENYVDAYPDSRMILHGDKSGTVFTIFSPQGGCGKSVISASIAHYFSMKGQKVLLLNLESLQTSNLFTACAQQSEYGLSHLFFHLKNKKDLFPIKIELCVNEYKDTCISYFSPFCSSLELDEISETDISSLLIELRKAGMFDIIIIDTDSTFCKRNISLLENSHTIFYILINEYFSTSKLDTFEKELTKIAEIDLKEIFSKIIPIWNKYSPSNTDEDFLFNGQSIEHRIPYLQDMIAFQNHTYEYNFNNLMGKHIQVILDTIANGLKTDEHGRHCYGDITTDSRTKA